jgi:hypothetical protein
MVKILRPTANFSWLVLKLRRSATRAPHVSKPEKPKMKAFFVLAIFLTNASVAMAECGTRGGPGLRNPNTGQCESWANVGRACSGGGCIRERVAPGADEAISKGGDIDRLKRQAHGQN